MYEIEVVDEFAGLEHLVELNILNNPVMVHLDLQSMVTEVRPEMEIFNKRILHEVGYKAREDTRKIRQEIEEYGR